MEEKAGAFIGEILEVSRNELSVFAGSQQSNVPIFTNNRVKMAPKVGDTGLFLRVEGGYVCIGILQN